MSNDMPRMSGADTTELLDTLQRNKILTDKVKDMKALLDTWYFSATGIVGFKNDSNDANTIFFRTVFRKGNGDGFQRELDAELLKLFTITPDALIEELVNDIYLNLFKQEIKNRITNLVTVGLKNAGLVGAKV